MNCRLLLFFLVAVVFSSCKKNEQTTISTTSNPPVTDNTPFQPGSTLVVSRALNIGNPRMQLSTDTVYSGLNNGIAAFKPLPTGFDNAIVSFYLPVGFIVVFAENNDGTGESVCFVSAHSSGTCH